MPRTKKVIRRYKEVCRAAIEAEEVAAPEPYTPPSKAQIATIEESLGIRLPADYLQFHAECEGYQLPFWDLYVLTGDVDESEHLVEANRGHRRTPPHGVALPEQLVAFFDDGTMTLHCFNTSERDKKGNYAIVTWDHETEEQDPDDLEIWAESFTEWLEEQIDEAEAELDA
ncbi:SMI1/KNR4 family protein [Roseimaritima sediminicola]|uniref:SMI1/KNR4 family protein n=1 Tax=Roseimaritima sediminicola TaxID=2662066 RepID=UPI001386E482|nr:SMI1/KNR4 family protein [Roseimaritima sediminicola]